MTYFKVLNTDGSCYHGGHGVWPENEWMPILDDSKLEPCQYGYHVLEEQDIIYWLGPAIAPAEIKGKTISHEHKLVVAQAKRLVFLDTWNPTTQRLFAADCAEHVLHIYTAKHPDDPRPAQAIEAARQYAWGLISDKQLAAAYAAAAYAVTSAAYAAVASAAAYAAYAAAAYAAYHGRQAEREWQTVRLIEYLRGERQ